MTLRLRRATHEDWLTYCDIRLRSLALAPDAFGSTLAREQQFDEATWRARCGDSYLLFGMLDNRVVATAAGIPDRSESGGREIVGMWVEPEARGRGAAASLVEALVEWATLEGASSISLWVADSNAVARRVYERAGFTPTGQREPLRDGLAEVRLRRSLRG